MVSRFATQKDGSRLFHLRFFQSLRWVMQKLKLQSIELISRERGFFRFRDKLIPAVRRGNGVGVACLFIPSVVDKDFSVALDPKTYLWFPTAKQIKDILTAMDRSDDQTFQMLKTGWGGERPRKIMLHYLM